MVRGAGNVDAIDMGSAPFVEDSILVHLSQSLQRHEKGLLRFGPRTLGLLSVDFVEHSLELSFKLLVLSALIELADEVSTNFQSIAGEVEGRST